MAEAFPTGVYLLCLLTAGACALLLARTYWRTGTRLLLWSALCFLFLAGNSLAVILDLLVLKNIDLSLVRTLLSLAAVSVLLYGFIWDRED
ncbi:MAG TPA: DUF5985 family protein [Allosphingosinicella sp.]|nr:DUF5985 family protein [Allosphingosinicella sp.]